MTVFDKIVEGGPRTLAGVVTDLIIQSLEKTYKNLGYDINVPDNNRNEILEDYYTSLNKEFKEN